MLLSRRWRLLDGVGWLGTLGCLLESAQHSAHHFAAGDATRDATRGDTGDSTGGDAAGDAPTWSHSPGSTRDAREGGSLGSLLACKRRSFLFWEGGSLGSFLGPSAHGALRQRC